MQREMLSLVTSRISDAYIRKPFYVEGATDLVSVCRQLSAQSLTHALVRDGERLGIFTTTDLRDALLHRQPPDQLPVRAVTNFNIVSAQADAELFEALTLMLRHRVHRLLVLDGDTVVGVLSQLDLVSFVAQHSHILALQIDEAGSIAELKQAASRIDEQVQLMHSGGARIDRLSRLVCGLNARLFARLWALLAPPELVAGSCLVVMGSEGRGEQILKTDQDNALILRDGLDRSMVAEVAQRFNAALAEFGYPPCPGGIMLTEPLWQQSVAGFRETLRGWMYGADPMGPMRLAIFFDAASVAGDASLLADLRDYLDRILVGNDSFFTRFAAPADQFADDSGSWWARLTARRDEQPLDLKKLGVFPIVHGVRALALQHHVRAQGTSTRLARLVALGVVDAALARDLGDALQLLMAVRLAHQLQQREKGLQPGNEVRASDLGLLERDPLRDSLAIVRRFRQFLHQHFRLDTL